MTLDEAIEHAKEVARTSDDRQRASDHVQIAEWLRRARGADKAARWYTAKIRELENRSKALETLISEKDAENAKLRNDISRLKALLIDAYVEFVMVYGDADVVSEYADRMRERGIVVDDD